MQTAIERGWRMRKVKARTSELLAAIRKNYEAHQKAYAEAFDGYKEEAAEAIDACRNGLEKAIGELAGRVQAADRTKGQKPVALQLPGALIAFSKKPPQDHSSDYEVVIRMLEFETSEIIEVEQDQFESYVMDRWAWKDDFLASHATYAGKLAR